MDDTLLLETLENRVKRRESRRNFFRTAGGFAAGATGALALASCGDHTNPASAQVAPIVPPSTGPSDGDILNFALNLEYLEAQFYSYAATGAGLASTMLSGTGTQGAVTGGAAVPFSDPVVANYAREIAKDEREHVTFLRTALGSAAVAQPAIDIGGTDPNGAFSNAARAAGLVGPGVAFNPYANDANFLLGAFIFEDVGVTAYKGASPLITNKTYLEAAAGILAVEAYHAGLIRSTLYAKGIAGAASLLTSANAISDARDSLDGPIDDDQGLGNSTGANIAPTDNNGIAFSRSTGQVLNIVYLTKLAAMKGGFFPNGVNGSINTSAANG